MRIDATGRHSIQIWGNLMYALTRACAAAVCCAVLSVVPSLALADPADDLAIAALLDSAQPQAGALAGLHADQSGESVPATLGEFYSLEYTAYRSAFQSLAISTLSMLTVLASGDDTENAAAWLELDLNHDGRLDLRDMDAIEGSGMNFDSARAAYRDITGTGWIGPYLARIAVGEERDITGTGFDLTIRATRLLMNDRDITGTGFDLILDLGEGMQEERDITGTGFDVVVARFDDFNGNRDITGTGRVAADARDILGQQVINAMNRLAADDVAGAGAELVLAYLVAAEMLLED